MLPKLISPGTAATALLGADKNKDRREYSLPSQLLQVEQAGLCQKKQGPDSALQTEPLGMLQTTLLPGLL